MIDEVAIVFISSLINPRMDLRTIDKTRTNVRPPRRNRAVVVTLGLPHRG